jgi:hypothetical protein
VINELKTQNLSPASHRKITQRKIKLPGSWFNNLTA